MSTDRITLPPDLADWQHLTRQNSHKLSIVVDGETISTRWRPDIDAAIADARYLAKHCGLIAEVAQLEFAL